MSIYVFLRLLIKIADSDHAVRVRLHRYCNPLNLEYVSDKPDAPYCCCNSDECASSMSTFTQTQCNAQCVARIALCLEREGGGELATSVTKKCYTSSLFNVPVKYSFVFKAEQSVFPNVTEFPSEMLFNLDHLYSVSLCLLTVS